VANGGHCVARHQGRVVFVRHALPGERVLARLDAPSDGDRFWRADAVEVLQASPDRVEPPCPLAGPGRCGGCDWQHAAPAAQRRLKAEVVREQLVRLGRVDPAEVPGLAGFVVESVPGDADGLGWRTRMRFAIDADGRPALRGHRSHQLVPVPDCPIAHPQLTAVGAGRKRWTGAAAIEVVVGGTATGSDGDLQRLVVIEPGGDRWASTPPLAAEASVALRTPDGLRRVRGRTWVEEQVELDGVTRRFRVTGSGFWQVHPGAAGALADAVLQAAQPRPGERAVDLYAGVGLFAAALALRVGPTGTVIAVETDARAVADARRNLHDLPQVRLEAGRVEHVLPGLLAESDRPGPDVVVLDPPRAGAGRRVIETVLAARPRVVVYVACDPASLARDVAIAAAAGYRLAGVRGFDLFPMTQHVECVASLVPADTETESGRAGAALKPE
jgi:tRNA/tmRNA/rRNA uracil-C5-methylase (TrmA/RlmC/RlmD family)